MPEHSSGTLFGLDPQTPLFCARTEWSWRTKPDLSKPIVVFLLERRKTEKRRRKELNKEKKRKKTDKKSRLFMMADDVSSADV